MSAALIPRKCCRLLGSSFLGFEAANRLFINAMVLSFELRTTRRLTNASRRAMSVIEQTGLLRDENELAGAEKVLRAAASTYIAALAVSLANLLRFVVMFNNRRRR